MYPTLMRATEMSTLSFSAKDRQKIQAKKKIKDNSCLLTGKWHVFGLQTETCQIFDYTMQLIQINSSVNGICSHGLDIKGTIDSNGKFTFVRNFATSSSHT